MPLDIRKVLTLRETAYADPGHPMAQPIIRVVGLAVITNPFAGQVASALESLFEAGAAIGERLMPDLLALLGERPAVAYGKAAIVGVAGEAEHGHACIHPMLGRPIRALIGGGKALIPSNVKVGPVGVAVDLPIGHKDDPWSRDHFDTITVSVGDAPRPDEIVIAVALADGGRPWPRTGTPVR